MKSLTSNDRKMITFEHIFEGDNSAGVSCHGYIVLRYSLTYGAWLSTQKIETYVNLKLLSTFNGFPTFRQDSRRILWADNTANIREAEN